MHISALAPFPIPFLKHSPCLFHATNLCFLIPAPFHPFSPFPLPANNPPNDLHIYDSAPALLVCVVCFLDTHADSGEFIAILMFIVLIFFFLNKPL